IVCARPERLSVGGCAVFVLLLYNPHCLFPVLCPPDRRRSRVPLWPRSLPTLPSSNPPLKSIRTEPQMCLGASIGQPHRDRQLLGMAIDAIRRRSNERCRLLRG